MISSALHLLNSRLSNKLFFAAMATALIIGLLLSLAQIVLDARQTRWQLANEAQHLLAVVREPAIQAAINHDKRLAGQVVEGLFRHQAVFYAAISMPGLPPLASSFRNKGRIPYPKITGKFLGLELSFEDQLYPSPNTDSLAGPLIDVGSIEIIMDPSNTAQAFLKRSKTTLLTGVAQAIVFGVVLYLIFRKLVTFPLTSLLRSLESIDPMHPAKNHLSPPKGHESDELGTWVAKINELFLAITRVNNRRRVAEAHIERLSNYDSLTELPNRSLFARKVDEAVDQRSNDPSMFAVMFCALDDFKSVNLLHSYHIGDRVLMNLTSRLRAELGPDCTIARVGGDVFALMVENLRHKEDATQVAQRVLERVRRPFFISDQNLSLSATIGIARFPTDGASADKLLKYADNAMQYAKSLGGNNFQFYLANIDHKIRANKVLEKQLFQAVVDQQLELMYQPQIDLFEDRIIGVEALVRWRHPERGLIGPGEFIPLAERSDTIIHIGQWVLETACATLQHWRSLGFNDLSLSINVSMAQLHDSSMLDHLMRLLEVHQIPPHCLVLEITETMVMSNPDLAVRALKGLKGAGVQLAIDDFGTGYSSLSYLSKLPFDEVKIDQSFVRDLSNNTDNSTIVDAIIQLGHSLNLKVIAEGVEKPDQIQHLKRSQCDCAQGYYCSKPTNAEKILELLTSGGWCCEGSDKTPSVG